MVLARMSTWKFKRDKRDEGFQMLDENISELFRKVKGFHGLVTLLSREDSDIETILTMWENEESLKASETIFKDKALKLEPFIIGTPDVKNYRVFSAELRH